MPTPCVFCEILAGRTPSPLVLEDEHCVAILDHRPVFRGHCLLIPRRHYETLPDVPLQFLEPLFENAQILCRAVEEALDAEGSFVAINNRVSQSVPHLHVHVVPRRRKDGLRGFFWPRGKYKDLAEQESVAASLRETVIRLKKSNLA